MIENNGYYTENKIPFNGCAAFCIPTVFIVMKHHVIRHAYA